MRVLQIGNFEPPHSTENDLKSALENTGHTVLPYQEQDVRWDYMPLIVDEHDPDFILWTRTASLDRSDPAVQASALNQIRDGGIPVAIMHLDLFWGLTARNNREHWIADAPYFQHTDIAFTADGNNDHRWQEAGVNHVWLPPAVAMRHVETVGNVNPKFRAAVGFVGSYHDYHSEWPHRRQLVKWLQATYRSGFKVWEGHIRGQDLADLYATVPVLIGDSCMVNPGGRYWSDRIPETIGRGGFLLHPYTDDSALIDLQDQYPPGTLVTWKLGDFAELRGLIDHYSRQIDERQTIAAAGRQHVIAEHTYEIRMGQVIEHMQDQGLLRKETQ